MRVIRGPLRKFVKSVVLQFAFIRVHSWLDQNHHEERRPGSRCDCAVRLFRMALVRACAEAAAPGGAASTAAHSGKARDSCAPHAGEGASRQTDACSFRRD